MNVLIRTQSISEMFTLPEDWALVPVKNKAPHERQWTTKNYIRENIATLIRNGSANGIGVKFGSSSNGLMGVDHDGSSCDPLIESLTKSVVEEALPPTVCVTSGKQGRYTSIYRIPQQYWDAIQTKVLYTGVTITNTYGKAEKEQLNFCWQGSQSVVAGAHPETGSYKWVGGRSPTEIVVADAPLWMIEQMLKPEHQPPEQPQLQLNGHKTHSYSVSDRDKALNYLQFILNQDLDWYVWRNVLFGLHAAGVGEVDALTWSRTSSKHTDKGFYNVWKYIKGRKGIGLGTLGYLAKQNGWVSSNTTETSSSKIATNRYCATNDGVQKNSDGMNLAEVSLEELVCELRALLAQELNPSDLQIAKIKLRNQSKLSVQEFNNLWTAIKQEHERTENLESVSEEIDSIFQAKHASIKLSEFLPERLAVPLQQLAKWQNLRPECYLIALLTVISAIQKNGTALTLHRAMDFKVAPNIFAAIVSEVSQKKSAIIKAIMRSPLKVLNAEARELYKTQLAQYESALKASEHSDPPPQKPEQRIYFFTKTTGEAPLRQASRVPDQGLLWLTDELSAIFNAANQYRGGRGTDNEDLLEYYDGIGGLTLRADGVRDDVDSLNFAIFGGIQPGVLEDLVGDGRDPNGRWSRVFFILQPTIASEMPDDTHSIDLQGVLVGLYRKVAQIPQREYTLSRDAFKYFQSVYNRLERLRVEAPNPSIRAVWGKTAGRIGKLSENLHVVQQVMQGVDQPPTEIQQPTVVLATKLAYLAVQQIQSIYQVCCGSDLPKHLVEIIELSQNKGWLEARDVQQTHLWKKYRWGVKTIRQMFRDLHEMGYGEIKGEDSQMKWSIHSSIHEKSSVEVVDSVFDRASTTGSTAESSFQPSVDIVDNSMTISTADMDGMG